MPTKHSGDLVLTVAPTFLSTERDKGKTVEVGRAYFETDQKHFTILDAPGHKSFVPNMIGGACQADLAVLVSEEHLATCMNICELTVCKGCTGAPITE